MAVQNTIGYLQLTQTRTTSILLGQRVNLRSYYNSQVERFLYYPANNGKNKELKGSMLRYDLYTFSSCKCMYLVYRTTNCSKSSYYCSSCLVDFP